MPTAKDLILKPVKNLSVMQSIIEPTMKLMRNSRIFEPIPAIAPIKGIPDTRVAIEVANQESGLTNKPLKTIKIPKIRATNTDVLKSLISNPGINFDKINITIELTNK